MTFIFPKLVQRKVETHKKRVQSSVKALCSFVYLLNAKSLDHELHSRISQLEMRNTVGDIRLR